MILFVFLYFMESKLVCVNSHTILWPKYRPKLTKRANKCQRNVCFMFVIMQARICHKKTKNQANTGKTGTRVEDGQIVKAGIQKSTSVLHLFKIGRISPCTILLKIYSINPRIFKNYKFSPCILLSQKVENY